MAIRVLIDVDVCLPLKRVLVVNGKSCQLFSIMKSCLRRTVENCGCDQEEKDVSWSMINKMFGDDPNVLSNEDVKGLGFALPDREEDRVGDKSRVGPDDDDKTVIELGGAHLKIEENIY
ncbi:hypothetical protein DVH24_036040 [Malus domestica]|uniref:Uncharacterized protein n=1 Tax=Malus domestica TaxID=3750 RepID=A0A498JV95_MALDO|nr:hypothetical protein DVH24_036040 [Malus domestica]